MLKACNRILRDTVKAFLGPRHSWGLSSRAMQLSADVPSRLADALARTHRSADPVNEQPVFLFAAGWRSGSTLLQRMIMEHNEDILMWGEPFAHSNIHDSFLRQVSAFTHDWPRNSFFLSKSKFARISDTWAANLYPDVEHLLDAHRAFYRRLFGEPATSAGRKQWGLKEVRLTIDHAAYFRALYPRCKIILLYRNPYDTYLSYRNWNIPCARTWPEFVVTPYAFGRGWAEMTRGYLEGHKRVDALLIRYEDLDDPAEVDRLRAYLGWRVPRSSEMRRIREPESDQPASSEPAAKTLPAADRALLRFSTGTVLRDAGYAF